MPAASPTAPSPALTRARRIAVAALSAPLLATVLAAPAQAATATALSTPASRTVTAGTATRLTTRLTSAGTAVAGRPVKLLVYNGGVWEYKKTAYTGTTGYASFAYAPAATRYVRIVFRGDTRYAPSRTANIKISVSALGAAAVSEAGRHLGKDYNWGSAGPYRFDCSGFTLYVFGRLGKSLPHNSVQQASVVRRIAAADKKPGDLIFFRTYGGSIDHVGIYIGGNYVYAASRGADTVKKQYIYTSNIVVGRVG